MNTQEMIRLAKAEARRVIEQCANIPQYVRRMQRERRQAEAFAYKSPKSVNKVYVEYRTLVIAYLIAGGHA